MTHQKKFKIATLGCRTNQYESQAYHDQLAAMGYQQASDKEAANLCIVNTCTVTASADTHSRQAIRQLIKDNPGAEIVVTGCLAERQPEELLSIPGVTKLIPNLEKESLIASLFPETDVPEFNIKHFEAHTRAFIKVQDGCNSFCTYCIIPYVRGRSRSRSIPDVLKEVRELIANGYKEIVLTGINIGDFDGHPNEGENSKTLADLVRAVDKEPGLERLRISSIDPDEVNDDLADAVLNGKTTCPSMHLVLQSGSNVVLKRMNRKYTRQIFLDTVEKMRTACPDFTVTTDIIVGFPGETTHDFEETLAVMESVKFAKVHMFPYSERDRTRAALYPNKVPQEIIKERKQKVLQASEKMAYQLREGFINRRMFVLTESKDATQPTIISGHTSNFLPVMIHDETLMPNQIVEVKLTQNSANGFVGELIG